MRALELAVVDFDLHDLVQDRLQVFAEAAHTKGLELVGSVERDLPREVRGDPARISQILTNLIANAIKFTADGEVVLRVTGNVEPTSEISLFQTDTRSKFPIADSLGRRADLTKGAN